MAHGNGKIANLPARIQDELNWRLNDGDLANELAQWLNTKPEVMEVMRERFDGRPVTEQNLSEWRNHGYKKWLAFHIVLDESSTVSENTEAIAETGIDCDKLLLTLTAFYAAMIQRWNITPVDEMTYKIGVFKNLTNGVIALRRAELQKIRLEIQLARLELLRDKKHSRSASTSPSSTSSSPESAAAESPCSTKEPDPEDASNPTDPARSQRPEDSPTPATLRASILAGAPRRSSSSAQVGLIQSDPGGFPVPLPS